MMQDDRQMIQSDGTVAGEAIGMIMDNDTVMQGEKRTALEGPSGCVWLRP